jgi:hypothetical protein
MRDVLMTTSFVAAQAKRDKTRIYEVFNTPECQPFLPPRTGIGESRRFNRDQAILLMLHSDFARWGLSVPFAGKLVSRVGEALADHPVAGELTIAFHDNGASFYLPDTEERSAEQLCGRVCFRVTIDLAGYRSALAKAVGAEAQVIGASDAA